MSSDSIQDILPFIQQPSRYLGTEINAVHKAHAELDLKMVLAFPDLYEIGSSHFGMQILYHLINRQDTMVAERVFAPAQDYARRIRAQKIPLTSLESGTPLKQFDIIGFSLLYELNYTNILTMLDLAEIPFYSSQRDDSHPLIIAGGPCTCNPEPVADFFDAMVIGDGEEALLEMARVWIAWNGRKTSSRNQLLKSWADIPGVYVPGLCRPLYYDSIRFGDALDYAIAPKKSCRVSRTTVADLDAAQFPDRPVVPFGRPVHDRLRMELARGCTRGCRFCQAGMLYRPVRERAPETLVELTGRAKAATGYDDISLLSLSTGDYGCIEPLLEKLMTTSAGEHPTAVSLPSLRAGSLSPRMMELIKQVRKTGFTLAPEAGTQRLRDVINKNITEADILQTVTQAFELGWRVIKLYFMIGLPTETDADLDGIVDLVTKIQQTRVAGKKRPQLNVSVTTFIPKAFTPFQWAPQLTLAESRRRIEYLQRKLKRPRIKFKWQPPEVSYLEGLWARGDRRLAALLVSAYGLGCQFDGWSDHFRFDLWRQAIQQEGIDGEDVVTRGRDLNAALPWDHIDIGVSRSFLRKEWDRAHCSEGAPLTADCRTAECAGCGVCDFKSLKPRVYKPQEIEAPPAASPTQERPLEHGKFKVTFSKLGPARFFGHLELVNIMTRAMRRATLPIQYSQGFHPKPKIAFADALPIGIESHAETMIFSAPADLDFAAVPTRLNPQLPSGLKIINCQKAPIKGAESTVSPLEYGVYLSQGQFSVNCLDTFNKADNFTYTRRSAKGKLKTIDLKTMIKDIEIRNSQELRLILRRDNGSPPRPAVIMTEIFGLGHEAVSSARVVKFPEF